MGDRSTVYSIFDGFSSRIKIWLVTEVRWRLPNFSQSPFFKKRVLGTRRVPVNKVHARFVLSKHVRRKKLHTDKTMESRKSDRSSGDYGTVLIRTRLRYSGGFVSYISASAALDSKNTQ